ncbi:3-keto-disaccharide hydrolase [Sunxiuqinia sp. A32]|uniref:3-keto-disaccharide hydrolase n=1 Tax=Sunxiuqinia sp. A32 TaxID=3461496 RepID=UPI0040457E52
MKIFALHLILLSAFLTANSQTIDLFNKINLDGWHLDVPAMDQNPDTVKPFLVRDGLLVSLGVPGGHLISDSIYANYRLEISYRFAGEPGNCGVLVHVSTPRVLYNMFPQSIEVQMQSGDAGDFWCIGEDIQTPEMIKRRGPKKDWGITEGKQRRIKNLTDDSEYPLGEWNTMIIKCTDRIIKVWVNGDKVNYGFECTANKGQIALQAEGAEVEFRKVQLTYLDSE